MARKGKAVASTSAAPPATASGAFPSPASASPPPAAILRAVPASLHNFPPLGASSSYSSSSRIAAPLPPRGSRAAIGEGGTRLIEKHILNLQDYNRRGHALEQLAKMVAFPDLARFLWFSFGTMAILLQEMLSIYPMIPQSSLTAEQSSRACNVLVLFQCVASHPTIKVFFTKARFPVYLFSFLSTNGDIRAFEHVRLATLGVLGALVKVPNTEVITLLLSFEIMPICLRAMEGGTEMSRTVATFILRGLLHDSNGLEYTCHFQNRLYAVLQALGNVVAYLSEMPSTRLLKRVVNCYLHLLGDRRGLKALKITFPKILSDGTFDHCICEDQTLAMWLQQLIDNVQGPPD